MIDINCKLIPSAASSPVVVEDREAHAENLQGGNVAIDIATPFTRAGVRTCEVEETIELYV